MRVQHTYKKSINFKAICDNGMLSEEELYFIMQKIY
jgi:hypothetical protein